MSQQLNRQYAPLLPFNESLYERFQMYDNVSYVRDITLIDEDSLKLHQPSMIKYFRCDLGSAVPIGGD